MQYKILVVDDETANLRLLERLFRGIYEVIPAASATEAIELLSVHDISLIISDQRMPGMTGIEFLKRAAEMRPQTVRIMLTGYSDAEALVEAINSGSVYKYITKPWVNEELLQTAKRALQHCESLRAQRQLQVNHERLRDRVNELFETVMTMAGEMLAGSRQELSDNAHKRREIALKIGRIVGLEPDESRTLGTAAFMLDIIGASADPSIEEKYPRSIKRLRAEAEFEEAIGLIEFSAERFDGTGEPHGYAGEEIPLAARVLTVADAVVRFTNATEGDPSGDIVSGLRALSGSSLDPEIVEAYCGQEILQLPTEPSPLELFA